MIELSDPSGALFGFGSTILVVLGGIIVALINTRHRLDDAKTEAAESKAMVIEIHTMVNSQREASERRNRQLIAAIIAMGGTVPADTSGLPDEIELAAGTVTVTGEAVTVAGDTVSVTGEATILGHDQDETAELVQGGPGPTGVDGS